MKTIKQHEIYELANLNFTIFLKNRLLLRVFVSLMYAIFFVAFDSKYYYTSSSCRLKYGAPQTFSASPNYS